jgi:regulatory protein
MDEPTADNDAPKITRSSDYKKKTSKTTFGSKLKKAIPGEYSRTSDKPSTYKKHDPAKPRQKPKRPAHQYAGRLLLKREYSAAVLRQRLVVRGYSEEEADAALELLQRINFQSDQRFAELTGHQLEHRKGNAQVAVTLKQKGIADDLATAVIEQMQPEEDRVLRVVEKFRKDVVESGMTHALKKKIYDFLKRRGFSSKSIQFAVTHLTKNEDET